MTNATLELREFYCRRVAYCRSRGVHRTPAAAIRCSMPTAAWIYGGGPYAVIVACGGEFSVVLHATGADATVHQQHLTTHGCGPACCQLHTTARTTSPDWALDRRATGTTKGKQ